MREILSTETLNLEIVSNAESSYQVYIVLSIVAEHLCFDICKFDNTELCLFVFALVVVEPLTSILYKRKFDILKEHCICHTYVKLLEISFKKVHLIQFIEDIIL